MLLAGVVAVVVVVALWTVSTRLNRRTVARHIEEGTMPRSKRLQEQVLAESAKAGITPTWAQDPTD